MNLVSGYYWKHFHWVRQTFSSYKSFTFEDFGVGRVAYCWLKKYFALTRARSNLLNWLLFVFWFYYLKKFVHSSLKIAEVHFIFFSFFSFLGCWQPVSTECSKACFFIKIQSQGRHWSFVGGALFIYSGFWWWSSAWPALWSLWR